MKVEKVISAMSTGAMIHIYLDTYKDDSLSTTKLVHTMTIEQADEFVRDISNQIHRDTRPVSAFLKSK